MMEIHEHARCLLVYLTARRAVGEMSRCCLGTSDSAIAFSNSPMPWLDEAVCQTSAMQQTYSLCPPPISGTRQLAHSGGSATE